MNTENLSIEQIKERLAGLIKEMPTYYKAYFKEDSLIKETKSIEYNTIPQNGFVYFESRDATHFIIPTNIMNKSVEPHEYQHKVMVYNTRTNLFDTIFFGLTVHCLQCVWQWQEKQYGFNLDNRNKALTWLNQTREFFEWTGELLPEEFNAESQKAVLAAMEQAREELGIKDEEGISAVSIEESRRKSSERAKLRNERKRLFEEEKAKFEKES